MSDGPLGASCNFTFGAYFAIEDMPDKFLARGETTWISEQQDSNGCYLLAHNIIGSYYFPAGAPAVAVLREEMTPPEPFVCGQCDGPTTVFATPHAVAGQPQPGCNTVVFCGEFTPFEGNNMTVVLPLVSVPEFGEPCRYSALFGGNNPQLAPRHTLEWRPDISGLVYTVRSGLLLGNKLLCYAFGALKFGACSPDSPLELPQEIPILWNGLIEPVPQQQGCCAGTVDLFGTG